MMAFGRTTSAPTMPSDKHALLTHSGTTSCPWIGGANPRGVSVVVFPSSDANSRDDGAPRCLLLEMLNKDELDSVLVAVHQEPEEVAQVLPPCCRLGGASTPHSTSVWGFAISDAFVLF